MEGKTALVVEDEFFIAEMLRDMLEDMGIEVCAIAEDTQGAIAAAQQHRPDIILMDVRLKGQEDGVDAALAIYRFLPGSPILFITGSREQSTVDRINEDHPAGLLYKPFRADRLQAKVRELLEHPPAPPA